MGKKTFQQYGELADTDYSPSVKSGRYWIQAGNEASMIRDVLSKLELQPTDRLFEIGCGAGNLLIPLSFMVAHAAGIDHPKVIENLEKRFPESGLRLIGSDFLDYDPEPDEQYEKILMNSVMGVLSDEDEALRFIDKAAGLLTPGGKFLIGDIANVDKRSRFIGTKFGKAFEREWKDRVDASEGVAEGNEAAALLMNDDPMLVQTDEIVLGLVRRFRRPGWEAYCLPQPADLPFGYTREDILIQRLSE